MILTITDEACERDEHQQLAIAPAPLSIPALAPTCPSCESHNVSNGHCGDCGLTDDLSAFMGSGMTANAKFQPSKFAQGGGKARSFDAPRAWTVSGGVD